MTGDGDLSALAARTAEIYERNAVRFDRERSRSLFERGWLDRFLDRLSVGGAVLDIGCGSGDPIAAYILDKGFAVAGVDIAPAMIDLARARLPNATWKVADMRTLTMGQRFDGILSWHSFFHLTADDQRATLARFADHLYPGGMLLLTVGPAATEAVGRVGDDPIYHASLSPEEYRDRLADLGLDIIRFVAEDPACDYASVLLSQKRS